MDNLWFIALDTARRRATLRGLLLRVTEESAGEAAIVTGVKLVAACAVSSGVRALVRGESRGAVRVFVRRLAALLAVRLGPRGVRWKSTASIGRISPQRLPAYVYYLEQARASLHGDDVVKNRRHKGKSTIKKAAGLLRVIERANETLLGADEAAARLRRYTAAHEAPRDDRSAFERLCTAIFSQGLGFEVVEKNRHALDKAFSGFEPHAVAQLDEAYVGALLHEPIMRNRAKVTACIENARRWQGLANAEGTYVGRLARLASDDDPATGWPSLVAIIQDDFCGLHEPAARTLLKRWGFFTSIAHPGAKRVLTRLELVCAEDDGAVQRFVGELAKATGRDPYAIEASLAIFAGLGSCRREPLCAECVLDETCPEALRRRDKALRPPAVVIPV